MELTKTHGSRHGAALVEHTTKYVALDVHQASTSALAFRENAGYVRWLARDPTPAMSRDVAYSIHPMRSAISGTTP